MTTFTPRETPTEQLREYLAAFETQLTWGLSAQARTATRIKAEAIRLVLRERGEQQ